MMKVCAEDSKLVETIVEVQESARSTKNDVITETRRVLRGEENSRVPGSSDRREGLAQPHLGSECLKLEASGGYRIRLANTLRDRMLAWNLTYEAYVEKEYTKKYNDSCLLYNVHDALPETLTFLVERDLEPVAAVTLVFDTTWGLPSDEACRGPLAGLRGPGRRLCELVSLVSREKGRRGAELLKHLFKIAYISAHHLKDATDFVITVNPRHTRYYQKMLLFEQVGDEFACHRVQGAPAVLLHLDLVSAWEGYRRRFEGLKNGRDLYSFFLHRAPEIKEWIRQNHRPLTVQELSLAFSQRRSLLTKHQVTRLGSALKSNRAPACGTPNDASSTHPIRKPIL